MDGQQANPCFEAAAPKKRSWPGLTVSRHCERSEAIHSFFVRWHGLLRFARNDKKHTFAFSPRVSREFCFEHSALSNQRAQGMPGARCTRGLVCNVHEKCAHEHTGQRRASDIPCAMALRLIACSCVLKICQNVR